MKTFAYICIGALIAIGGSVSASTLIRTDGFTQIDLGKNTILTDGILLLYSFDGADVVSETVFDRGGQGNNGTVENFSTTTTPVAGIVGQGLFFDNAVTNTNKVVSASVTGIDSLEPRTLAAWTFQESQTDGIIMSIGTGAPNLLFASACLAGEWGVNAFGLGDWITGVACTAGWHHHVVVYDGADVSYYLDGENIGSVGRSYNTVDSQLTVGARPDDGYARWVGIIDDVRVYDHALSSAEALQLFLINRSTLVR